MRRHESILYPQAFLLLYVFGNIGNETDGVSLNEALAAIREKGREPDEISSYQQLLRHMKKKGFIESEKDGARKYGHRVRWKLTDAGVAAVIEAKIFYEFALDFGKSDQSNS